MTPQGKRRTLYLTICGRKASWKPRRQAFSKMSFCDAHKKLMDQRVEWAKESIGKLFQDHPLKGEQCDSSGK